MEISSTVHKQPGQVQFAVLDVIADGKPFFAGLLIGNLRTDPPTSTETSNRCLERLTAAQDQFSNTDEINLVEIRSPERGRERVPQIAAHIARYGAAAFYCLDTACYDAVWEALKVAPT